MTTAQPSRLTRVLDYDAIVVGARVAGAATAMLLARAGRRVLMVDRAAYGADTLSTHALLRGGVLQLARWGLLDGVRDAGTPPVTRTRFHYGEDIVDVAIRAERGIDGLYAPRRTLLDRLLVDAARDAGVEVQYGVRVVDLLRGPDGVVHGICGQGPDGETFSAAAPVVIGADGIRSSVARLVDAPDERRTTESSAFIYAYFRGIGDNAYNWYFRPGVTAGVIPTNDGVANVFVGLPPGRFFADARAYGVETVFRAVLHAAAPEVSRALSGVAPVGRMRSFPGQPGHLRRSHGPGWALVGDAGYFKDPITAHGITDALRDAELLTRSLLETGDAAAYQRARDVLAGPFLTLTARTAAYDWSLTELVELHLKLKKTIDAEVAMLTGFDESATNAA
jgi:flavin-dependent dehydrogenase